MQTEAFRAQVGLPPGWEVTVTLIAGSRGPETSADAVQVLSGELKGRVK